MHAIPVVFVVLLVLGDGASNVHAYSKVRLNYVQTLTLYRGKYTTGRRSNPVPQMSCVGGDACRAFEPDVVQCSNMGSDGTDPQWRCQAELPTEMKFGPVSVSCEGFDYPNDPYILEGSCGLQYTLYYSERNNDWSYPRINDFWTPDYGGYFRSNQSTLFKYAFTTLWFAVLAFILYRMALSCARQRPRFWGHGSTGRGYWGGGGGGDGGGGGGDPGPGFGGGPSGRGDSYDSSRTWFWSGLGLGGLAGYLLRRPPNERRRYQRAYEGYRPAASSSSSFSRASSSENTYTATGFGGTTRR